MKKVLFGMAVLFGFANGTVSAEDAAAVIAKIKTKDTKMESEFKDLKMVMNSKMTAEGMEMESTMQIVMKGKKKRTELTMMGMKTIIINDGKDVWMIGAQQGKRKMNNEKDAGQGQTAFGWADDIKADSAKVTEEEQSGRKCYVVDGTDKQGEKGKWFVDKKSLALVKFEGKNGTKQVVILNSDFKKVKGDFEMPYKMEVSSDGKPLMSSFVTSVEFNKGVDDGIFNIDSVKQEDLGKMDMESMMKMMQKQKK